MAVEMIMVSLVRVRTEPSLLNLNTTYTTVPLMVPSIGGPTTRTLNAAAVARVRPFICHAPPLMMCDLGELDSDLNPTKAQNIGRQIRLNEPQKGGSS